MSGGRLNFVTALCHIPVGGGMVDYRLYCLDRHGRIQTAEWISATDDADALSKAIALGKDVPCELWDRARLVAEVPPAAKS